MLRQLLDNAIPEDGSNYLTVVSEGLREIEGVRLFCKILYGKKAIYVVIINPVKQEFYIFHI